MRQLRTQLKYLPCLLQPKANINIKECFKALREQATSEEGKLICEVIALAKTTTLSHLHGRGAATILENLSIHSLCCIVVDVRLLVIVICLTHTIRYYDLQK